MGHRVFLFIHPELEVLPLYFCTQPPSSPVNFQAFAPSLDRGLLLLVIQQGIPIPISDARIRSLPSTSLDTRKGRTRNAEKTAEDEAVTAAGRTRTLCELKKHST